MTVDEAKYDMGWLCLKTQPSDALRFLCKFKSGNYEIKKIRQRRSLDANAFCWVMLDKLSEALGVPKEELYSRYIKEMGGVSDILCVPNKAVDKFREEWERKGLGWQTDTIPIRTKGCTGVIVYYGSSVFDVSQMQRLIQNITDDCIAIGIDTKSQEEIDSLLAEWGRT